MFTYFHHSRGKRYRAKIIHGRYDRSFWYRHNECSFPSSWNSICGETRIKYNKQTNKKCMCSCNVAVLAMGYMTGNGGDPRDPRRWGKTETVACLTLQSPSE